MRTWVVRSTFLSDTGQSGAAWCWLHECGFSLFEASEKRRSQGALHKLKRTANAVVRFQTFYSINPLCWLSPATDQTGKCNILSERSSSSNANQKRCLPPTASVATYQLASIFSLSRHNATVGILCSPYLTTLSDPNSYIPLSDLLPVL